MRSGLEQPNSPKEEKVDFMQQNPQDEIKSSHMSGSYIRYCGFTNMFSVLFAVYATALTAPTLFTLPVWGTVAAFVPGSLLCSQRSPGGLGSPSFEHY
jgi:hypothetical protein